MTLPAPEKAQAILYTLKLRIEREAAITLENQKMYKQAEDSNWENFYKGAGGAYAYLSWLIRKLEDGSLVPDPIDTE